MCDFYNRAKSFNEIKFSSFNVIESQIEYWPCKGYYLCLQHKYIDNKDSLQCVSSIPC